MKTQSTNTSAVQCQEINKTPTISKCERIKRIYSRRVFSLTLILYPWFYVTSIIFFFFFKEFTQYP